jgi:tryptophanyl-tRNA synthetase
MRILTGLQPSGALHLGNYFAAIAPILKYQEQYDDVFLFVADYHAMTSCHNGEILRHNTENLFCDLLALGVDPEKICFYVQSDIPEVQELTWFLHSITPVSILERGVAYKEKVENGILPSVALFSYPSLQASDILIMNADKVPVGKDQKQHIEMTRDIAQKFHTEFGEVFTLPEPMISEEMPLLPGVDGRKMSKSYKNTIPLFASESELKKQVMSIVTDSKGIDEPKDPDQCIIFTLYSFIVSHEEKEALRARYLEGNIGYGEAKKLLLSALLTFLTPFSQKKEELLKNPEYLHFLREKGKKRAQAEAQKTMEKVRKMVGV